MKYLTYFFFFFICVFYLYRSKAERAEAPTKEVIEAPGFVLSFNFGNLNCFFEKEVFFTSKAPWWEH